MRSSITVRALASLVLFAGAFLFVPAAQAQFVGVFGTPYRPFDGRITFQWGKGVVKPSRTIDVRPALDGAWTTARGPIADFLKKEIGKSGRFRGQTAYNVNVQLAAKGELQAMADGPRLAIKYILRGNSVTAKMTTPTIFGSYADPKFTVDFDVEVVMNIGRLSSGKIGVTSMQVSVHNARLRGRNVTGTVGLAIADIVGFVGGPNVRTMVQNAINGQRLTQAVNVALAPVTAPGDMFCSMSGTKVFVRILPASPGPIVR